jgi:protein O-mannosyl-transferase
VVGWRCMRPGKIQNLVICAVITAAVAALYSPVIRYSFVNYDDDDYVAQNSHVRAGVAWSTVEWAFSSGEHANWHPLTWMSHALDVELFGVHPSGHHFTNVALHALNSMILFLLLFFATQRTGPSLIVALLFAAHPINVESVAWIAERKNVLSTFFFLLTLGSYGWFVRKQSWGRYAVVFFFFGCGLMAKPMLVTLPFVLLLVDYWPLERTERTPFWRLVVEKIPLLLLSAVSSAITFHVQQAGNALRSSAQFPFGLRIENALVAYALYVWKLVWPARLTVFYPYPSTIAMWEVAAAGVFLAAMTMLAIALRRRKYVLTGWLWFLGTLVPVIGVVQVGDQAMADRYAYIPFIGLFLIATWSAADFFQSIHTSQPVTIALAASVLIALSLMTARQVRYWSSNIELWMHALAVTRDNALAERKLGFSLISVNLPTEGLEHLRQAVAIHPNDPTNHINLGLGFDANQQREPAIEEYKKAISLASDTEQLASAYTNLGIDYDGLGNEAEAYINYNRALQLNPKLFNAYFDRGLLLEKEGKFEDAVADYRQSLAIQPSVQGYLQLTRALEKLNRESEARASYEKAQELASEQKAAP